MNTDTRMLSILELGISLFIKMKVRYKNKKETARCFGRSSHIFISREFQDGLAPCRYTASGGGAVCKV